MDRLNSTNDSLVGVLERSPQKKPSSKLQSLFENYGLEFLPSDLNNEKGESESTRLSKAQTIIKQEDEDEDENEEGVEDSEDSTSMKSSSQKVEAEKVLQTKYTSATTTEKIESKEMFRIAFVNYRLSITDGIPQPIPGFNQLFIGSIGAAYNFDNLRTTGITHILCLSEVIKLRWPETFCYRRIAMSDKASFNLQPLLQSCFSFIDEAITYRHPETNQPGKILVHCYQGISRSTAVCCAYMMSRSSSFLSRDEALERIRVIRPKANPNSGFLRLLKLLEEDLRLHFTALQKDSSHTMAVATTSSQDETNSQMSEVTDTEEEEEVDDNHEN